MKDANILNRDIIYCCKIDYLFGDSIKSTFLFTSKGLNSKVNKLLPEGTDADNDEHIKCEKSLNKRKTFKI